MSKVGDDSRFDHVGLESSKHVRALLEQQTLSLIFLERLSELTRIVQISGGYGVKNKQKYCYVILPQPDQVTDQFQLNKMKE